MKLTTTIKRLFKKPVVIEATSTHELVDRLKWAEVEVEETKCALSNLRDRLAGGIVAMEDIAQEAQEAINYHQQILEKSKCRKQEFTAQCSSVTDAMKVVEGVYDGV